MDWEVYREDRQTRTESTVATVATREEATAMVQAGADEYGPRNAAATRFVLHSRRTPEAQAREDARDRRAARALLLAHGPTAPIPSAANAVLAKLTGQA
jgi:hypothetical protein